MPPEKLSELELTILAILKEKVELHGYAIGEELELVMGREIGPGAYYRVLHRLERKRWLKALWESEEECRARGANPKNELRRYYSLNVDPNTVERLFASLGRTNPQTLKPAPEDSHPSSPFLRGTSSPTGSDLVGANVHVEA